MKHYKDNFGWEASIGKKGEGYELTIYYRNGKPHLQKYHSQERDALYHMDMYSTDKSWKELVTVQR